jgi:hypothetical protein
MIFTERFPHKQAARQRIEVEKIFVISLQDMAAKGVVERAASSWQRVVKELLRG